MYTNFVRMIALIAVVSSIILIYVFSTVGDIEGAELYIESINLFLITAVLFIGVSIHQRVGGPLKPVMVSINVVLSLFWLKELIAVLNELNILELSGSVVDFVELLMIGALLLAINKLRLLI